MKLSNTASALLITATATLTHATDTPASTPADPTPASDTFDSLPPSNTNFYWSPLSTLAPVPTTPPSLTDHLSSLLFHDLLRRQGAPVTAPAAASVEGQTSPVTTIMENQLVNGVQQQVQVVYTQLFSAVPEQWDAPASGSLGLGTIKGEVGVVRTNVKREVEVRGTAMAVAEVGKREEIAERLVERREEGEAKEKRQVGRRESMAGKTMEAMSAGSALALLVAITAMVIV